MIGLSAVLIPKIKNPISISKDISFPFSFDYIVQCFLRLQNRKNHETLDSEKNPTFYLIHLMFLKFYKLFQFSALTKITFLHEVSYTVEKNTNEQMEKLSNLLETVFKNSFVGKDGRKLILTKKYNRKMIKM